MDKFIPKPFIPFDDTTGRIDVFSVCVWKFKFFFCILWCFKSFSMSDYVFWKQSCFSIFLSHLSTFDFFILIQCAGTRIAMSNSNSARRHLALCLVLIEKHLPFPDWVLFRCTLVIDELCCEYYINPLKAFTTNGS